MALYEELKGRDLLAAIQPLVDNDILEVRHADGKLIPINLKHTFHTPWLHQRSSYRHNCYIWKDIVFENIIKRVFPKEKWFVPSSCMGCYKVVVRPRTLKELFDLAEIQYALDLPSKCGVEARYTVFGNYGGYFYNRGLEEGRATYKKVREMVDTHISPDVKVLLKRSCTEHEHSVGPSDKWIVTPAQKQFEEMIENMFQMDVPILVQQHHLKDHVLRMWIEEAYKLGDETVWQYIDGPLYPPYVTYHDKEEES